MTLEFLQNEIENILIASTNTSIRDYDCIEELDYSDDKVTLKLKHFTNDENLINEIKFAITKHIKQELEVPMLKITLGESSFKKPTEMNTQSRISDSTKLILVASGKGGVGKSQVTVNLAYEYQRLGHKVGIIDADIYGYSIPKILDLYGKPQLVDQVITPITKDGIEVISAQYFIENNENKSITWRGNMLGNLLRHFFYDVGWSQDLDYIFIDMPPGTGDVYLDIPNLAHNPEMLIVTTASEDASHVAIRVGMFANELSIPIIGVIQNMAFYEIDNQKHYIFGQDGGHMVANELNVPLLGEIAITKDDNVLASAYEVIVQNILV
jgi:ATP-binding protein involved in chromosome partitioning